MFGRNVCVINSYADKMSNPFNDSSAQWVRKVLSSKTKTFRATHCQPDVTANF